MTPECETSENVEVSDGNGGVHIIKVVVPRVKMHNTQFWGIIGGMLGAAAVVATLLGAFFMSKTEAAIVHGAMDKTIGEHIAVDDLRDEALAREQAKVDHEFKAMQHNLIQIGARVRARDLKTADDFNEGP